MTCARIVCASIETCAILGWLVLMSRCVAAAEYKPQKGELWWSCKRLVNSAALPAKCGRVMESSSHYMKILVSCTL